MGGSFLLIVCPAFWPSPGFYNIRLKRLHGFLFCFTGGNTTTQKWTAALAERLRRIRGADEKFVALIGSISKWKATRESDRRFLRSETSRATVTTAPRWFLQFCGRGEIGGARGGVGGGVSRASPFDAGCFFENREQVSPEY
jgi:hypothetical protein